LAHSGTGKSTRISRTGVSPILGACTIAAIVLLAASASADARIGGVAQRQLNGTMGVRGGALAEQLVFDRDVFAAKTMSTPSAGSTVLRFADSTQVQIGQNSSVILDHFVYDPQTPSGDASIEFHKGIFPRDRMLGCEAAARADRFWSSPAGDRRDDPRRGPSQPQRRVDLHRIHEWRRTLRHPDVLNDRPAGKTLHFDLGRDGPSRVLRPPPAAYDHVIHL